MFLDRLALGAGHLAVARRITVCGLVLATLAAAGRGCSSCAPPVAMPPSLVWDGETYAAAWAVREGRGIDIYVHRFAFEGAGEPVRVIRVDALRGTPELAAGPDGFLLLAARGDGDLVAAPLDAAGHVRGEVRRVAGGVEALCAAPGWLGDSYAAAWLATGEDGGDRLTLAALDRSGAITRAHTIAVPAGGSCALAAGDGRVALVFTARRAAAVMITTEAGEEWKAPAVDSLAGEGGRVLRLVARAGGFAILLRRASGALRVVEIDRRGRAVRAYDLASEVATGTADLGASERGLFVAWSDHRRAWLAGLASDGTLTTRWQLRAGGEPSGVRALGRAGECAAAWTSLGGLVVHAAVARDCPRD